VSVARAHFARQSIPAQASLLSLGAYRRQCLQSSGVGRAPCGRWNLGYSAESLGCGWLSCQRDCSIATLNIREVTLHLPAIESPPAKLIGSITDEMVEVFDEATREQVIVEIVGIPPGRFGVGGEPA
jgi:phenylpyruvate tautomerase PptA (4-oxalocrotonate tautomerase family)